MSYIENGTILLRTIRGRGSFVKVMQSWEEVVSNAWMNSTIKGVLGDYREAELQMNLDDLNELANFFKGHMEVFQGVKFAFVTDNPNDIVIPLYAEGKYPEFKIHAFSSLKPAISWIKMEN